MKKIVKAGAVFERKELPREEAIKFFADRGESYKVELIEDLPEDETISLYQDASMWISALAHICQKRA